MSALPTDASLPPALDALLGRVEHGRTEADDGFPLAYQTFGRGPAVVFANGLGVTYPGAALQIAELRRDHQVVCWDYRGMGASVAPSPPSDVSTARHARDLLSVLDDLGVDEVVFVGWSMGVQVGLEVARLAPQRMKGYVALLGSYAQPIRKAFPPPLGRLAEGSVAFGVEHPYISQTFMELSVAFPDAAHRILSSLSFVDARAHRPVFDFMVYSVTRTDRRLYLRTLLAMAEHDGADMLAALTCPCLIVCGDRDYLTPPRVARKMAAAISDAEYREVRGGTHFAMAEQSDAINGWTRSFLARAI